jgi:hypothetical protein
MLARAGPFPTDDLHRNAMNDEYLRAWTTRHSLLVISISG